jgi:Amt family ammonium transporter
MEIWIVACAAGALLARVGLALYTCGLVRAKNAGGSLLRHLADLCLASLAFWAVGIAILSPGEPTAWIQSRFLFGLRGKDAAVFAPHVFLMLTATLLASGIIVGTLSERSRFWPSLAPSILLGALLVPMFARWCGPAGWLGKLHFHDYAGASYIHLAAGLCAAVGAIFVCPRNGKYNRDGSANVIPGHSLPLACGGVLLILVAWFPYLLAFGLTSEHSVGLIALNALLATAAAGVASLGIAHFRYGKPDIYLAFSGVLGGLVAITAGADAMSNLSAVFTGAIAGVVIPMLMLQVDLVWRVDDPTGALVIHGVGGAWGILAAGLFASINPATGRLHFIGTQLLGLAAIAAAALATATGLFFVLKKSVTLRARESDEFDGLDLAEHDIGSYPDFQQTTIKSYHLREA